MTQITCGIFLFDSNKKFLVGHPTGSPPNYWSIPKGKLDEGETEYEAAIRELKEETGFDLLEHQDKIIAISEIDKIKYRKRSKYLKAYFIYINMDLTNHNFFCDSLVKRDIPYPEMDKFALFHFNEMGDNVIHETQVTAYNTFMEQMWENK